MRHERLCLSALFTGSLLLLAAPACSPDRIELHLRAEVRRPPVSVVLFFVDGLDRPTFKRIYGFGLTPNIHRIFERDGVEVREAFDCLPAATYPNTVSLFTGMFPGHHGVVGNGWFDPVELTATNYLSMFRYQSVNEHFASKTLYEYLGDQFTFNVQCPTRRGVTESIDSPVAAGLAYALKSFISIDELAGTNITHVAEAADRRGEWPSVVVHYFPGVDEIGHQFGSDSFEYLQAVRNADHQIGKVADAITRLHPADKTYFILVTDHGHMAVTPRRTLEIENYLTRQCGLRIYSGLLEQADINARKTALKDFDAIALKPSFREALIYLRGDNGWGSKPTLAQIEKIVASPSVESDHPLYLMRGVGVVCIPLEANCVRIHSRHGCMQIQRRMTPSGKEYRIVPGPDGRDSDPLRYRKSSRLREFVNQGWHSSRDWLVTTAETNYPDFVPQIVEYFDAPRAGHLLVFPEEDYVLSGHAKGEHGACYRRDMHIPMFFAGPDLPHDSEIPYARIVDIVPTILQMLGMEARLNGNPPLDGVGLLDELRHAKSD